jgi:polyhydroxybutyrate depolymerase
LLQLQAHFYDFASNYRNAYFETVTMQAIFRISRRLLTLCATLVFISATSTIHAAPLSAGRNTLTIESGGRSRSAQLYIPTSYVKDSRPSLLVLLHGGGGSATGALNHDGWAAKAEQQNFLILAPEGLGIRPRLAASFKLNPAVWNSGQFAPNSATSTIDDVAFVRDLLDTLKPVMGYDEAKVFATGHSNGAGMTFRLGAELSERFAAIAMVAGRLAIDNPKPTKPLPTLYIVGTADPLMPLEGGEVKSPWSGAWTNRPLNEQLSIWARANQCDTTPQIIAETSTTKTFLYPSIGTEGTGRQPASLTVVLLKGHGHHWPGARETLSPSVIGPITGSMNATDVIWDFFTKGKVASP